MTNLKITQYYERIIFFIVAIFVIYVRIRFADMAMERDEGEYAYAGSQILRGPFPFKDFYNMKLPGVYYCYALIMGLFGKTVLAIRLGVLFLNLMTAYFIIKLGQRWINEQAGWLAGAFYLFLSVSFSVQGIIANCEHFVLFFIVLTLWLFSKEWCFMAGFCAALAIFMKQQAAILLFFALIYAFYILISKRKETPVLWQLTLSSLGFILPFAVFMTAVWRKGVFDSFQFFVIDYAQAYVGINKPHTDFGSLYAIMQESEALWWAGKISLILALFWGIFNKYLTFKTSLNPLFLVLFLAFSYAAVLPGWYYRPHYHQYIFPAAALLMAYGWSCFASFSENYIFKAVYASLLVISLGLAIHTKKDFYFQYSHTDVLNTLYPVERFQELRDLGTVLNKNSLKTDTIGMMGHEPELFFYADRVSASGYLYSYPFIEHQPYNLKMATQYANDIKTTKPKWFIDCFYWFTWEWFDSRPPLEDTYNFIKKNYYLRGALYEDRKMEWNIDSVDQKRKPFAIVFERRDSGQNAPKPLILN
jgi:4-amino-4-deoxy-L-arabinose transferase-like glycosyltransferase